MNIPKTLAISGIACLTAIGANAETMMGETLFGERCAVCHGASGAGDGLVGELFAHRPKDLRILARENGGSFPFGQVMQAIDGRTSISAHGGSEMPIWGDALMEEALIYRGINPKDARMVTDARVHALTVYIQSLQVD
jgi:mono/diheme cytochrome c family protein